uniref:hypothetical protein n=1 Tax=Thaumasiovibrio occultus TaxID=1891184 RepID=UPI00131B0207|nr:hypothetical protein [Thaumasiovibrio occultus]
MSRRLSLCGWLMLGVFTLSGCNVEVVLGPNPSSCSRAQDPNSGRVYDVEQRYYAGNLENGYQTYYDFVRHFECGPAAYFQSGDLQKFTFFRHGEYYSGYKGITDITFDYRHGYQLFMTNQVSNELPQESGWTANRRLYRKLWQNEAGFEEIEVVREGNSPNTSGAISSRVELANGYKRKNENQNTNQYDCTWFNSMGNTLKTSAGCANEASYDRQYLGRVADIDGYIADFRRQGTVSYSTDPQWYRDKMRF